MSSAIQKAKDVAGEIEDGVLRFLKATATLYHEGCLREKGEIYPAFSSHTHTLPAEGNAEQAAAAREEAAERAREKAAMAASGSALGGDRVISTALNPQSLPPASTTHAERNDGADLV